MRASQMLPRSVVGLIPAVCSALAIAIGWSLAADSLAARAATGPDGWMSSDTLEITGLPTTSHVTQANWELSLCGPWYNGPEPTEEDQALQFILNAQGDTIAITDDDDGCEVPLTMPLAPGLNQLTIKVCGFILVYQGTGEFDPDQWDQGCETRAVVYWFDDPTKTYGAHVTPAHDTATHIGPTPRSVFTNFRVISDGTGHQETQVSIVACTGVISGCVFSSAPGGTTRIINLLGGTTQSFGISYSIGSAGWGTIKFVASSYGGPTFVDTGIVVVKADTTSGGPAPFTVTLTGGNPGVNISRGACFSMPVYKHATVECDDVRIVQPLPSTTTMNRERAPVLTYLSRHAKPGGVLAVDVALDDSISATELFLIMKIGNDTVSRVAPWNATWNHDSVGRAMLPFDAAAKGIATGVYTYDIEVWALLNGAPVFAKTVHGDTLVVVNRTTSPFGNGWWLDGYEQLNFTVPDTNARLWIGGDGSTRLYSKQSSTVWTVAPSLDRPDTLLKVDSSGTTLWRRQLGNGAYVQFNNAGQHVATVNDRGHKTRFMHNAGKLDSIVLPVPDSSAARVYRFKYDGNGALDSVFAPSVTSTSHRRGRVVHTGSTVTGFTFTDGGNATYTLSGSLITMVNGAASFTYGTGSLVTLISGITGLGSTSICPAAGVGLLSCRPTAALAANASTFINGPQSDAIAADTMRIKHTRYGAPHWIKDPFNSITTISRTNATFPMLVTSVVAPNGFEQRTTYTSRGLVDSVIAVDPYGTSHNAVTRFTWHSTFNRVTQVIGPTGDMRSFAYDGNGLMTYDEDGRGSSTRTDYGYDAHRRLAYVEPPGHASNQRYRFSYDSYLGNSLRDTTPLGYWTETLRDSVGRPVSISAPIDSNPSSSVRSKRVLTFNAWGCVLTTQDQVYANGYEPTYSFSSISGTASNADLEVTNTCNGFDVTAVLIDGVEHAVTQNPYGRAACGGVVCAYDLAGNVKEMTTSAGTVYFTYDALNRVIERRTDVVKEGPLTASTGYLFGELLFPALGTTFPYFRNAGDTLIHADTARFVYDSVTGDLLKAYNRDARINRSYYANGALKADSLRIGKYVFDSDTTANFGSHKYVLQYEYDLAGRRTKLWLPTNVAHSCNPCSQDYHYLAHLGALDTVTTHLGNKFTFAYDDKGRLTGRDAQKSGAVDIVDLAWAYDLDDRVTRRLERRFGGSTDTVHFDSLWYDARGKVTKAALKGSVDSVQTARFAYDRHGYLAASEFVRTATGGYTRSQVFDFDANGNLDSVVKSVGSIVRAFTYDDGRLVAGVEHVTGNDYPRYVYDVSTDAGPKQLKSALRYNESLEVIGGSESAAWHQSDGKLRNFQRDGDDASAETRFVFEEYRYDALGRRVLRRSRSHATCTASFCKSAVERFVWDGNQILFEMRVPGDSGLANAALETDTSTVNAHYGRVGYVHGGGIDAPLAVYRNGIALIPHANWRGFYDAGTDTSGAAVTSTVTWIAREQAPFMDNQVPDTVKGWAGSLMQSGQDQSGLFYRRNRYYDSQWGRFTQTDPIGLSGGRNLYGYAAGDPVNFGDPNGLCRVRVGYDRLLVRGANHLFVVTIDTKDTTVSEALGTGPLGLGGQLRGQHSYPDRISGHDMETVFDNGEGISCDGIEAKIDQVINWVNANDLDYHLTHRNSNSFVRTVMDYLEIAFVPNRWSLGYTSPLR